MSFNKLTTFNLNGDDIEVLSSDLVKTASFKIPDGFSYDPDYLYLKVKAVSAGEYWGSNKNDDYFPEVELVENYKSFLVAHTFKNHENKKIENAIGDVLSAEWSDRMKCVYLIIRIDNRIAPSVVRGFEKGFMTDVSMGCRVDHVICSYCGQKAKTRFDYCDHLKTMKGKVMDNGKKVYEINIKPKFHDISAVLNGAERTAKVEGIYVNNAKVALSLPDKSMEKVASFKSELSRESLVSEVFRNSDDLNMEVIASSLKQDKKVSAKDVENSTKQIEEKIKSNACSEICEKNHKVFEEISDSIKYNFTKYWDRNTCINYGKILKNIAQKSSVRPEQVFSTFLKILDASGIELSPLEVHDIFFELFDFDSHDLRKIKSIPKVDDLNFTAKSVEDIGIDNLQAAIDVVRGARAICENDGFSSLGRLGVPKLKAVIIKKGYGDPGINDSIISEIMDKIVSHNIPMRSYHRPHLITRLEKISNGDIQPVDNSSHFVPIRVSRLSKCASESVKVSCDMTSVLYSAYQNDRVNNFNTNKIEEYMDKIAFMLDDNFGRSLEKTAGKKLIGRGKVLKASMTGFPVTIGYSGIQRARINNGEEVSSLNRFIAENPITSALLLSTSVKGGAGFINKNHKRIRHMAEDAGHFVKSNADKLKSVVSKNASESIFNNKYIDDRMNQAGYKDSDLQILKYATTLNKIGDEATADSLLHSQNLSISDIDKYLKVASDYYKIEFEKIASNVLKSIGASIGSDIVIDNVKKGSTLAMLPGYIADGVIFTAIGKGLKKATAKKPKEGNLNV